MTGQRILEKAFREMCKQNKRHYPKPVDPPDELRFVEGEVEYRAIHLKGKRSAFLLIHRPKKSTATAKIAVLDKEGRQIMSALARNHNGIKMEFGHGKLNLKQAAAVAILFK